MTNIGQHIKAYSKASYTTPKTQQIVMLYDGAIRFMQHAREAMEKNDIETRFNKLTTVSEILMGLQSSLDFEAGGQMASVLYDFYATVDADILSLHHEPNLAVCDHVISELREMRNVWASIHNGVSGTGAAHPADEPSATQPLSGPVSA